MTAPSIFRQPCPHIPAGQQIRTIRCECGHYPHEHSVWSPVAGRWVYDRCRECRCMGWDAPDCDTCKVQREDD